MAFTQITIQASNLQLGDNTLIDGSLTFTPTTTMRNGTAASETTVSGSVTVGISAGVLGALTLAATDDPGTTPLGVMYKVEQRVHRQAGVRTYYLAVPYDGGPLDLNTAAIVETVPGAVTVPVPGPTGPQGEQGPTGPTGPAGTLADGSVTNVKVASGAAISADKLADGTTGKIMTAAERTKLAGIASGATAYTDEQARDLIGTTLVAGTNVTITPDDAANTVTIAATGGGGGGAVDSVNGQTGVVVLDATDVGATALSVDGSFVSTYDIDTTPVTPGDIGAQPADADLTAIAGLTHADDTILQTAAGAWAARTPAQVKTTLALAKGDVGLGNVDNTSDLAKPISTATQTALGGKVGSTSITTIVTLTQAAYDALTPVAGTLYVVTG